MKTFLFAAILAGAVALLPAQEASPTSFPHSFGLAGGMVTGNGLSYRYWPQAWGFQVSAFPLLQPDYGLLSLGITALIDIADFPGSRFFGYFGGNGSYVYGSWLQDNATVALGGGLGFEFHLAEHIGFDLQGGLVGSIGTVSRPTLSPSIEGGIYYRL